MHSASAGPQWTFDWVTTWDEIWSEGFLAHWTKLMESPAPVGRRAPFFHPEVVRGWYESGGGRDRLEPYFLLARSTAGHDVLFPLVRIVTRWKQGWLKVLQPAGGNLFDYHDPIVSGPAAGEHALDGGFWNRLEAELTARAGRWFDRVPAIRVRSPYATGRIPWVPSDDCPCLDLAGYENFPAYFQRRKKPLRDDLKRQLNRLNELGEVVLSVATAPGEAVDAWIASLEESRRSRYPDAHLPRGYLRALAQTLSPRSPVHVSALLLDGKSISWHIGFSIDRCFYYYMPSFDAALETYSPGKLHLYFLLQAAFDRKVSGFDFMRGGESYKFPWTDGALQSTATASFESPLAVSRMRRSLERRGMRLGYVTGGLRKVLRPRS